ncbi:MAG: UPF0182 family protein, partial [Caldilineaceae bacterium]
MRQNDPFEDLMRSLEETLQRGGAPPGRGGSTGPGGSGDGDDPLPPDDRPIVAEPRRRSWGWLIWVAVLGVVFLGSRIISFLATWTWFSSVGYEQVFWTRLWTMAALFVGGAIVFLAIYLINLIIARAHTPFGLSESPLVQIAQSVGFRVVPSLVWIGVALSLLMGLVAMGQWEQVLRYINQVPFASTEPLFDRNVGFFVFTLPVWEFVRGWLMVALGASFAVVLLVSGLLWNGLASSRRAVIHLAVLATLMLLLSAWQYQMHAWNLVYSQRGAFFGAGYADARAELP